MVFGWLYRVFILALIDGWALFGVSPYFSSAEIIKVLPYTTSGTPMDIMWLFCAIFLRWLFIPLPGITGVLLI